MSRVQSLLAFIDASPSAYHAVASVERELADFSRLKTNAPAWQRLDERQTWQLDAGGRYYVVRDDSSIIVFTVGTKPLLTHGFKIIAAHTDSPGLRIKPNAATGSDGLLRLGVEIYGGPILATFTDRDLSLAGRLSYQTAQGALASCLVRFDKPLLRLPNLAIHLNRGVNDEGLKLQKQQELPLLLANISEQQLPKTQFHELLAKQAGISDEAQLLSWDLSVYDTQTGSIWGANNEFYADSQLDNLASCHCALQALLDENSLQSGQSLVCAFFDHEEVGSESSKGADGSFLSSVLARIASAMQLTDVGYSQCLAQSFLISADMAHAYQPNFPLAYEPEHKVLVNQGVVIKTNASQRYASGDITTAQFIRWCKQADVPYQHYVQRCDMGCGSTVGPTTAARLGIRAIDVGNPMWAMHSVRESAGVLDHAYMIAVMCQFFSSDN